MKKKEIAVVIEESTKLYTKLIEVELPIALRKYGRYTTSSIMLTALSKTIGVVIAMHKDPEQRTDLAKMVKFAISNSTEDALAKMHSTNEVASTQIH